MNIQKQKLFFKHKLVKLLINNIYKILINNINILNMLSLLIITILFTIIYFFIRIESVVLIWVLPFLISVALSSFILDEFKYSEIIFVRYIQKIFFYNFILIFIFILFSKLYFFDSFYLINRIYLMSHDIWINEISKYISISTDKNIENINIYYFSIKNFKFKKIIKKLGYIFKKIVAKIKNIFGIAVFAVGVLSSLFYLIINLIFNSWLFISERSFFLTKTQINYEINNIYSISQDQFILPSVLDKINSPLQDLLLLSFLLDLMIIVFLFLILLIIFNRYIAKYNLNYINNFLKKNMPIKITNWFNKYIMIYDVYNDKIVLYLFIIYCILLLYLIFLKLIIISALLGNIDSFITVHNHVHGIWH